MHSTIYILRLTTEINIFGRPNSKQPSPESVPHIQADELPESLYAEWAGYVQDMDDAAVDHDLYALADRFEDSDVSLTKDSYGNYELNIPTDALADYIKRTVHRLKSAAEEITVTKPDDLEMAIYKVMQCFAPYGDSKIVDMTGCDQIQYATSTTLIDWIVQYYSYSQRWGNTAKVLTFRVEGVLDYHY